MKLQLKRSNVLDNGAAKTPTSAQLDYGELAVNYNNGDPAVFLKDSNDNVIRIAGKGATGLDGDYVNVTGDNMTGDLTFDTDKIVLGLNGAATFTGTVTANAFSGDGSGLTDVTVADNTLPTASTSSAGIVQLTDSASSSSTTTAATPNAVKAAYDRVASYAPSKSGSGASGTWSISISGNAVTADTSTNCLKSVTTSNGLTGGGVLNADRVISAVDSTTSAKGVVQLTDSASSTSTTTAATPNAVKAAYDRGSQGITDASTAQSRADLAVTNAATAQARADLGVTNAATAQAQADLGVSNSATAQARADKGVSDASTADGKAVTAQGAANAASSDAATADGKAVAAQSTGDTALANAATAQSKADAALPKAGGTITGNLTVNGTITGGGYSMASLSQL